MDFKDYTQEDLLKSALAETAKATNEIKSAKADISKAQSRLSFVLMILNRLTDKGSKDETARTSKNTNANKDYVR